ncbi:hypothetical protein C8J57DRAFT_1332437 [Mycena rebaudengoi]|nr:hypothetical protein C8J57DRAFT_1332437 [Mycena rebaudengoi]
MTPSHSIPAIHPSPMAIEKAHPIHRLAAELLALILIESLPDGLPLISRHPSHVFSHVCGFWRSVAVAIPRLWATFTFALSSWTYPDPSPNCGNPHPRLLALFLQRSGVCGLRLRTFIHGAGAIDTPSLRLFLDASDRWAHIHLFYLHNADQISPVYGKIPCLRILTLQEVESPWRLDPSSGQFRAFEVAPRLETVNPISIRTPSMVHIPVRQLDHLTLSGIDGWNLLPNLGGESGVKNLHLIIDYRHRENVHPPSVYTALRALVVSQHPRGSTPLAFMAALDLVTAPNLASLIIRDKLEPTCPRQSITSLVQRSGCTLHDLTLSKSCIRGTNLLLLLPHIESLRRLTLTGLLPHGITDKVLEALTPQRDRPALLQNLEYLKIAGAYIFRTQVLRAMIQSRTSWARIAENATADMLIVDLALSDHQVSSDELVLLQEFKEHGMRITLRCLDESKTFVQKI